MGEINMDLREIHEIGNATVERILGEVTCPVLTKHDFRLVGFSAAKLGFQFHRLDPDLVQLMIGLDGTGSVWLDGGWTVCKPGEAYVCPPHAYHAYEKMDDGIWSVCWLQASAEWFKRSASPGGNPSLITLDSGPIVTALEGLMHESLEANSDSAMSLWVGLLDIYLSRALSPEVGDRRLARVFSEVGAHPAGEWTLDTLADKAGMSGEQLRRLSLRHYGHSPMHHVAVIRMRHAESLLEAQAYTVARVAEAVGYDNPFAFSTAFKRVMGHPPSTTHRSGRTRSLRHRAL